jgi:hypothetical protein
VNLSELFTGFLTHIAAVASTPPRNVETPTSRTYGSTSNCQGIISHEKGYRAERQRVLSVVVPCCSWVICKESSVAMSYEPGTPGDYMSPSSSDSWMPWCAAHAPTAEPLVTLSELADMLGTEVVSEAWSA